MTEEQLYNFFYNTSDAKERFKMFNFLCAETKKDLTEASFSDEFIEWIGGKSEIANKIGVLDEYDELKKNLKKSKTDKEKQEINRTYQTKLKQSIESKKTDLINEWINLVESNHDAYIGYLKKLFEKSNEIKYVIISEAPMLTIKEDNANILFDCKYIFSEKHENVGSYRKVPFDAFQEINGITNPKKGNPSADDLIDLFLEKRVLFLDLIPLPLPKIDSDLRKNWSTNSKYFIDDEPRVITFLRCSLAFIFKFVKVKTKKEICFSDTKIALMMPSNSALGIINFYIDLKEKMSLKHILCRTINKTTDPFSWKIKNISEIITRTNNEIDAKNLKEYSLRLHRQVAIGSQGGPELELLKHALTN
jgi:hypothetical protein